NVPHIWLLPFAPLIKNHRDFLANTYFAITPFEVKNEISELRIIVSECKKENGNRIEKLRRAVTTKKPILLLQKRTKTKEWIDLARIKILHEKKLDQSKLKFSPFDSY